MRATVPALRAVTVLGCDGSYPGPGGAASGYLVSNGDRTLWLDAGAGTFARLQQVADPGEVEAVVLSHEHPDHWSDLESFAVWALQHRAGHPPVPVYAPPGVRRRSYFAEEGCLDWHELEPSARLQLAGLDCRFALTDHGPPTLAVRMEAPAVEDGPGVLVYSADTGPDWTVEELGPGVGTLLCEATFTRAAEGSGRHLSGRQAGTMAAAAGVDRLVVTHRWPTVSALALADECAEAFGRPVEQAVAGRVLRW